jgi:hypothetical protein
MSDQSDYLVIYKYEMKIEELVNHHIQKYKYVGEDGDEYRVIQTVFLELNRLTELSNKHIRWYAIIISLIGNFFDQRMRIRDDLPAFPSLSLEFTGDFEMRGQVQKRKPEELFLSVFVPPYITFIEPYLKEIARIGVLVSTKENISPGYLDYKFEGIEVRLKDLLSKLDTQDAVETKEEVFLLAIKNASGNALKLGKYLSEHAAKGLENTVNSERYHELIIKSAARIDRKRLAGYYNMNDFWNGFIP